MRADHDLGQIPVSVQKTEEFQQRPLRGQRIGNDRFLLHDFIKFQEHFILDFMEHIVDIIVMQIKGSTVDIHQFGQFLDGDILNIVGFQHFYQTL